MYSLIFKTIFIVVLGLPILVDASIPPPISNVRRGKKALVPKLTKQPLPQSSSLAKNKATLASSKGHEVSHDKIFGDDGFVNNIITGPLEFPTELPRKSADSTRPSIENINEAAVSGSVVILVSAFHHHGLKPDMAIIEMAASRKHFDVVDWYWSINVDNPTISQLLEHNMYFLAEWCYSREKKEISNLKPAYNAVFKDDIKTLNRIHEKDSKALDNDIIAFAIVTRRRKVLEWIVKKNPDLLCAPKLFDYMLEKRDTCQDIILQLAKHLLKWNKSQLDTAGASDIVDTAGASDIVDTAGASDNTLQSEEYSLLTKLFDGNKGYDLGRELLNLAALEDCGRIMYAIHKSSDGLLPKKDTIKRLYITGNLNAIKFLHSVTPGRCATQDDANNAAENRHLAVLEYINSQNPRLLPRMDIVFTTFGENTDQIRDWFLKTLAFVKLKNNSNVGRRRPPPLLSAGQHENAPYEPQNISQSHPDAPEKQQQDPPTPRVKSTAARKQRARKATSTGLVQIKSDIVPVKSCEEKPIIIPTSSTPIKQEISIDPPCPDNIESRLTTGPSFLDSTGLGFSSNLFQPSFDPWNIQLTDVHNLPFLQQMPSLQNRPVQIPSIILQKPQTRIIQTIPEPHYPKRLQETRQNVMVKSESPPTPNKRRSARTMNCRPNKRD